MKTSLSAFSSCEILRLPSRDYLIAEAGAEDPERHTDEHNLQHLLSTLIDEKRMDDLDLSLKEQRRWTDVRRIRELRDPSVSHDWLWALNPAHGPTVPASDFSTCLGIRLGADFLQDAIPFLAAANTSSTRRARTHSAARRLTAQEVSIGSGIRYCISPERWILLPIRKLRN